MTYKHKHTPCQGQAYLSPSSPFNRLLPANLLHRPRQRRLDLTLAKRRDVIISRRNVLYVTSPDQSRFSLDCPQPDPLI